MMKKRLAAMLAAVMMMSMAVCALAQDAPAASKITVQGTATVSADPDLVTVTANASVTAGSVSAAQGDMNVIVANATQKLLDLGVLGEDIVTSGYSYYPKYNYETNTIIGYEASHALKITCRDVEMLDAVIGAVTDSGFSEIYGVSYDVSSRSELYQQALDLAIGRAEEKAVRMAQTAGVTITGLSALSENGGYNEGYAVNATADMAVMKSAAGSAGIRSGAIEIRAGVTAVYEAQR